MILQISLLLHCRIYKKKILFNKILDTKFDPVKVRALKTPKHVTPFWDAFRKLAAIFAPLGCFEEAYGDFTFKNEVYYSQSDYFCF